MLKRNPLENPAEDGLSIDDDMVCEANEQDTLLGQHMTPEELPEVADDSVYTESLAPGTEVDSSIADTDGSESSENVDEDSPDEVDEGTWFDADTKSFLISMFVHVAVVVALASFTVANNPEVYRIFLSAAPMDEQIDPLDVLSEIAYSETPNSEIGSNSIGETDMALAEALNVSDMSELTAPVIDVTIPNGEISVALDIKQAIGITESKNVVKGLTGVGVNGTEGAVDRITYELLRSIEERPTLVVWLFDSSISMDKQRKEIRERFEKIYEELGIVADDQKRRGKSVNQDASLLTSIVSYGMDVKFLTERPTDVLEDIRSAVDSIAVDESGTEYSFKAIKEVAEKFKSYRVSRGSHDPQRNVVLITVTDERGDDANACEEAISICKKFGIQSHVLGVPAPFGREFTYIKFIDPDPKFDQTPDWRQVDQGPETLFPERVMLGYKENYFEEPVIDSGFGPYALSRLCYETGGIYFSIHPNRRVGSQVGAGEIEAFASRMSYFFAPDVMEKYRPDYVPAEEYKKLVQQSPMRLALIQASAKSRVGTLDRPRQAFVKVDEARLVSELSTAQQAAARLSPELNALCLVLAEGEKHKTKETSPRWLASFDLSYGTALAAKVRNDSYNAMLALAKRGMTFEKEKNNTWTISPSEKIAVDSRLEKEANQARELLKNVVENHPGTPWALLAARELSNPIGWEWQESFTDLNPPPRNNPPPNTPPPPPAPDNGMLPPPLPKRPVSKI
jgi:hypothetical protein